MLSLSRKDMQAIDSRGLKLLPLRQAFDCTVMNLGMRQISWLSIPI